MSNSLFYCGVEQTPQNVQLINMLEHYSKEKSVQIYIINKPLSADITTLYDYDGAVVVLIPGHKICFINLEQGKDKDFIDYYNDMVEDLGHLSEKYDYKIELGRPRIWKDKLITAIEENNIPSIDYIWSHTVLENASEQRKANLLISLLIGSINDINRIGGGHPETLLDQVKRKIILFDGDQSRFIYSQSATQKRVVIQGLAGTGKTELLLNKLTDLYIKDKNSKIVFTCYNKILAQSMQKRIPEFFNFKHVDEQIKWNERLWVMASWGSKGQPNTGVYSYICSTYNIHFHPFSWIYQFDDACKAAIEELSEKDEIEPCFDYIMIDESQDFPQSFFVLCELVTKNVVYIAGDIFQDIYAREISSSVNSDYLLNKCYRTDPKTLMFAHAVGMGLYEKPIVRWLEDEEWVSCGYDIERSDAKFIVSRMPLRRFEDLDMLNLNSIEVIDSDYEHFADTVLNIIDSIRKHHSTVKAEDIAIVFLEGNNNDNYDMADFLSDAISEKYSWEAIKGYETKDSTSNAVFISNRNNIKGLEFPFVICIVRGKITDDVLMRNTIYMMLTRSFITSYFLINSINSEFIDTYKNAADEISNTGKMWLREPLQEEKELQNQKVYIAAEKKHRPIKDIIEEVITEFPKLTARKKQLVINSMMSLVEEEGMMTDNEIQNRTRILINAYL